MKNVFKHILVNVTGVLVLLIVTAAFAYADTPEEGQQYTDVYEVQGGNLYFNGNTGDIVGCDKTVINADIPDMINDIEITGIFGRTFNNCDQLESVTVPDGITMLSPVTFSYCTNLKDIYYSEGMTTLPAYACGGASEDVRLHFPESLTEIGKNAFNGAKIKGIEIPETVVKINDWAFMSSSIESVVIPETVQEIGNCIFLQCESLKEAQIDAALKSIPKWMFYGCTSVEKISFAPEIKYICDFAFYNCKSLKTFDIQDTVVNIGSSAFCGCTKLENIVLPDGIKDIGGGAFENCDSISEVVIPESLETCGKLSSGAFAYCDSLEKYVFQGKRTSLPESFFANAEIDFRLELPDSLTEISDYMFYGAQFGEGYELIIPDTVVKTGQYSFASSTLREFKVTDNLTEIEPYSFYMCKQLENVVLSENVTSIGQSAFHDCEKLTSIDLPASLSSLGKSAFSESGLTEVYIPGTLISVNGAFAGCSDLSPYNIVLDENITKIPQGLYKGLDGFDGVYEIPAGINAVGDSAFEDTDMTGIVFHEKVRILGDSAFKDCRKLADISGGYNIKSIGASCFENCDQLKTVCFELNNAVLGKKAFAFADKLQKVELYGVKTIPDHAFHNCHNLKELIIGDGTVSIGQTVFGYDSTLEKIRIPASVTSISGPDENNSFKSAVTVFAPVGSYAQEYAVKNSIDFKDNDISKAEVKCSTAEFNYSGSPCEPSVTVIYEGNELEQGIDYQVKYSNNVNAGTAQVIAAADGFFSGKAVGEFTILKSASKITAPDSITRIYGAENFKLNAGLNHSGQLVYLTGNNTMVDINTEGTVSLKKTGKTVITVRFYGDTNYLKTEKRVTIRVKPNKIYYPKLTRKTSTSVQVSWKPHKSNVNVRGYDVQYSTSSAFKAGYTKRIYVKGVNNNKVKISNLKKNRIYYVRVRAYTKTGGEFIAGNWSTVKKIRL